MSYPPVASTSNDDVAGGVIRDVLPRHHATAVWARRRARGLVTAVVVAVSSVASYWSTVATTAQLYAPDTRYYAARALLFIGMSKSHAYRVVQDYTTAAGWQTPSPDILFGWGLVTPRIVYPALSAPFVKLFGIDGMAVVPGLAMAALTALSTCLLVRRYGHAAALAAVLLFLASQRIAFFGASMLTESLAAVWCALLLATAWRYQRQPTRAGVVWLVALTCVMAFTRQSTLIPAGAFVVAWLGAALARRDARAWRVPAVTVALTAIVVQAVQTLVFPGFSQLGQFQRATGTDSLAGALRATPRLASTILWTDLRTYVHSDRALLLLTLLSLVAAIVLWRRPESHMLVGAFIGTAVYNVTNGTPTGFRYAMPGLVFYLVAVAALVAAGVHAAAGDTPAPVPLRPEAGGSAPPGAEARRARPAESPILDR